MSATPRTTNGGGLDRHSSCARRPAFRLLFRHAVHFPVHRIGHTPVALRLAQRPARQHTIQAPVARGVDVGRVGLADEHGHVGVQVALLVLAVRRVAVKNRARLSPLPCAVVEAGQVAFLLLLGDLEAPHLL